MTKTYLLCFAAMCAFAASSDHLEDKLNIEARATYLRMDDAHRAIARNHLKDAHVSEEDTSNIIMAPNGQIAFVDHMEFDESEDEEAKAGVRRRRSSFDATPSGYTSSGVPIHHSNPGATKIIYLDFDGHQQAASGYSAPSSCPNCLDGFPAFNARPWTSDGSSSFSASEKLAMTEIHQRVAEDYAAFDVDVTTEEPATITSKVCRVLITEKQQVGNNNGNMPNSGGAGIAWVDVYDTPNFIADFAPALVFPNSNVPRVIAAVASHEAGHNFGLGHDGLKASAPGGAKVYYGGANGWSPIMGTGANKVTSWSKGEYPHADNNQDDIAKIGTHLGFRDDEAGESTGTATNMAVGVDGAVDFTAYITESGDEDWYKFTHAGGAIDLQVKVLTIFASHPGANMNTRTRLYNSNGNQVESNDPSNSLDSGINGNYAAGTYYLGVTGRPADDSSFTDYSSIGSYQVLGSIEVASTTTPAIVTSSSTPAIVTSTNAPTPSPFCTCPWGKEKTEKNSKKFNIRTTFKTTCQSGSYEFNFCVRKTNRVNSKVTVKLQRRKNSGGWATMEKYILANGGDMQCFRRFLTKGWQVKDGQRYRLRVQNNNRANVRVLSKHKNVESQADCTA